MYHWAACLKAAGYSVITTTTTKLADQPRSGISIAHIESVADAVEPLKQSLLSDSIATLFFCQKTTPGKLNGIPPKWIDQLSHQFPGTFFLVEGDGAAGRPLKGHLSHEPVVPACTSLVVPVIGIDSIGKPVDATQVHRLEEFCRITGAVPGEKITAGMIVDVLLHSGGYLRNTPDTANILPYLNKIENLTHCKNAKVLATLTLAGASPQISGVLAGSIQKNCLVRFQ